MGKIFDRNLFGKRLKECMTDYGDTIYTLGEYLELHPTTVSRYVTAVEGYVPKADKLEAMARRYRVNPAWLMGADVNKFDMGIKDIKVKRIPLLGSVACGGPIFAQENIEKYFLVEEGDSVDFCLRVKGDSMIGARIKDGDVVFVKKQPDVENGEIAVVLIDDEATVKRVYKYNGTIVLRSENPAYKEMVFKKSDMKDIRILGKVKYFRSEVY